MSEANKPLDVFRFIPVSGDGADLGSDKGARPAVFSYLKQIAANFWARIGRVRRASSSAMVGDPRTGAARRREYQALGIEAVIASGFPHPEEAYATRDQRSESLQPRRDARRVRCRRVQAGDRRRVIPSVGGRREPPAAPA